MNARKIEYNTDKLDGTGKHTTGVKKFSYIHTTVSCG